MATSEGDAMDVDVPQLSDEAIAGLGDELCQVRIRPQIAPDSEGKMVALDVQSGEFEVATTVLEACHRLSARVPNAVMWCVRVGHPTVRRFGSSRRGASV
jgi:hypothetical protein